MPRPLPVLPRPAAAPLLAALALAALAPAGAAAQAAADSLTLRFAWPVDTEATVSYTQVIEREGDGGEPTRIEIEGAYEMHVHAHPEGGLVIEHLDPLATRFRASPPLAADDPRRVVWSALGMVTPHYRVAEDGRLLGLEGVQALGDAVAALLGPIASDPQRLGAALAQVADPAQLAGVASERWDALVGMWIEGPLVRGEPVTAETEEPTPLFPQLTVPHLYEFTFAGEEPCGDGRRCARLEMVSFPDPVAMTETMTRALAEMGMGHLTFDGLLQERTVRLLADVETLLPHRLEMGKSVDGRLSENGVSRPFRRFDGVVLEFDYRPQP